MFGLKPAGHPRLSRILTDYGFKSFPLRKAFPMSGYKEVHFNELNHGVIYERVELMQEYRRYEMSFFNTETPYIYKYFGSFELRP
jgi:NADH-quinone oxidoreductase subunit C